MLNKDQKPSDKQKVSKSIQQDVTQHTEGATLQLEDNRKESAVQLKWNDLLKSNSSVSFTDNRSSTNQLHEITNSISSTPPVQMLETGKDEQREKQQVPEGLQYTAQLASSGDASYASADQPKSTNSGLPAKLQSGVESLSGQSMSDVTVHKNSSKPAQLQAHAFAQGSDIHVAPGQEKHLPHEAWHVAQQKQGRVKPTKQLKGKTNINDDEALEREADVMGAKAASLEEEVAQPKSINPVATPSIQFNKTEGSDAPVVDAGSAYSFTEPGFVFEKSQMRSLEAVAQIKTGPGNDATKADLVKSSKQKIGNELNPKALGFLIPVNIDVTPAHQVGPWTPTEINFQYGPLVTSKEDAKLKAAAPGVQGYLDSGKIIKSKVNLLKKDGLKMTAEKNEAAEKASTLGGKISSFVLNISRSERKSVNSKDKEGTDALKAGIESVKANAGNQVPALSRIQLQEDPQGTKVTPLGTYVTLVGTNSFGLGKEFEFTSTFKLNSHTDYSADYFGTSVKVPPIEIGDPKTAEVKVNVGEFIHEPSNKGVMLSSNQGSAAVTVLGQEATATWNSIELDTSKATDALKVKWGTVGMNLDMLGKKMNFSIEGPDMVDGQFTFTRATGAIDKLSPFDGVNFNEVHVEITATGGAYDVRGSADFELQNLPGIEAASGKVAISRASNGDMQYALEGGNLTTTILGQTITVGGLAYDSAKDPSRISADEASLALDLEIPTGGKVNGIGKIMKPSVSNEGFAYEGASIDFSIIKLFSGVEFTEVKGEVQSDTNSLTGSANFNVGSPTIANAGGVLAISKAGDEDAHYELKNGSFDATVLGQTVGVTGAAYDSNTPDEFSANAIKLGFDILNTNFSFDVAEPKINNNGFDFASVKATIQELSMGGLTLSNTEVTLQKEKDSYSIEGMTTFAVAGEIGGAKIEEANGQVTVSRKGGDQETTLSLADANIKLDVFGQKISVNELSYADHKLTASTASIEINAPAITDSPLTGTIENLEIANNDISISSATLTNIPEIDAGIITISPTAIVFNKIDGNYAVSASGGVTLKAFGGGNDRLLSGVGTVGYDFATKKTNYEITEATTSIKNPLSAYRIPESIPGIPTWPISIGAPIPIVPGVNLNISAYFDGGIGFKENIDLSLTKSGDSLTVGASTGIDGSLEMGVSVGVLAGVPLLASVEGGLEAGGQVAAHADVTLAKTFHLGKGKAPAETDALKPANNKAVTITGGGEISLLTKVFLKAQALVFIKKKVEKVLGKVVLGSFTFDSNASPRFNYISRKEALQSQEEMENLNKTMLPKSFQGMSSEEVKAKLQALRNEDNKLSDEATAEFVERFKVDDHAGAKDVFDRLNTLGYINYHNINWSKLSALNSDNESLAKFKANIKLVGDAILSKDAFLKQYENLITKAKAFTAYPETGSLIAQHERLLTYYIELNELKRKAHSQKFGDNFMQNVTVLAGRFTRTKSQLQSAHTKLDTHKNLYPSVVESERTLMEKLDPPAMASAEAEEMVAE